MLNYQGDIYQAYGYRPRWATDEPPIVYVGANKAQMLTMASGVADGIMLGDITGGRLAKSIKAIDAALMSHGRERDELRITSLIAWHVKEDREASFSEARRQLALRGMLDTWYPESFLNEDECKVVDTNRSSFFKAYKQNTDRIEGVPDTIVDKLVDNLTMSGDHTDVDRHIETLQHYRDTGLDEVALKLHRDHRGAIELIGKRLVPALRN